MDALILDKHSPAGPVRLPGDLQDERLLRLGHWFAVPLPGGIHFFRMAGRGQFFLPRLLLSAKWKRSCGHPYWA